MKTIDRDRNSLKRLVETYGKDDVRKFIKSINEEINEDNDTQTYLIELTIPNGGGWQTIKEKGYYIVKTFDYPVDENEHITDEALDSLCELNDLTVPHFPGLFKAYCKEETLRQDAQTDLLSWRVVEEGPDAENDYDTYLDTVKTVDYLKSKGILI